MIARIRDFPWFEVALIVGLAVALIIRPQTEAVSSPPDETGLMVLPLKASTQPRTSM